MMPVIGERTAVRGIRMNLVIVLSCSTVVALNGGMLVAIKLDSVDMVELITCVDVDCVDLYVVTPGVKRDVPTNPTCVSRSIRPFRGRDRGRKSVAL
jgi:hypothetical protein